MNRLLDHAAPAGASQNKNEHSSPSSIVVLISGRGSNMQAIVEQAHIGSINQTSSYIVERVISDNPSATGLTWARENDIDTVVLPERSYFKSKKEYYTQLLNNILEINPKLVCLAGFMKVLPPYFIEPLYPNIINIHPSLLPAFPGLNTHERVLAQGISEHGCSVHVVTPEIDAGPLIAQASVQVEKTDTPLSLSERVLAKEHQIYPWAVSMICQNQITLGDHVSISTETRNDGLLRGYLLPPG